MANIDTVRQMFEAYRAGDAGTAIRLLADDFSFTSPQDDHIDKRAFMDRCFPTAEHFVSQEIIELAPSGDDGVFIMYEYQLKTGERHRNTEFTVVRGGQLAETHVFFGGRYDASATS
jgi:ketosteroid isomerase-like protein